MKTFLCVVRRVLAVLLALIFALLGAACLIAIPLSNNYSAMISMAVAMPTTAKAAAAIRSISPVTIPPPRRCRRLRPSSAAKLSRRVWFFCAIMEMLYRWPRAQA